MEDPKTANEAAGGSEQAAPQDPKAAAEEAARAAAEELARQEAAEALRREEDEILAKAFVVRDKRSWLRAPPAQEPKRGKLHWDHLLEEMTWLAKEFQKERAWKVKTAKKYAGAVSRSNLDLESRVIVRQKQEEKDIRKRAAWIAREVMIFWGKAQRVVQYKVKSKVDAKKKIVLDKQLDFLLGQTQKYSSMLAQRLTVEERAEAIVAASKAEHQEQPAAADVDIKGKKPALPPVPEEDTRKASAAQRYKSEPPSAAVSGVMHDADDSKDYRSGEDDDADDEATLEEEDLRAQAEGRDVKKEEEEEIKGLEDEADLPLEELMARYGYVVPDANDTAAAIQAATSPQDVEMAARTADGDHSDSESEKLAALLEEPVGAPAIDTNQAGPSGVGYHEHNQQQPVSTASRLKVEFEELSDGDDDDKVAAKQEASDEVDEYRSGEDDDADDEGTLEEEEKLAKAEGRDVKKEEAEEMAGLADEAELPLEELMARYGYVRPDAAEEQQQQPAAGTSGKPPLPPKGKQPQPERRRTRSSAEHELPEQQQDDDDDAELEGANEEERMANALNAMVDIQPTGYTLETTKVKTNVPFLIKGELREYQHIGLDWLATLYHKRLNGILADEMGLGKTIQTIALLAFLACEKGDWGPHLVVVPTSVMLNWEMEFKKWCPAFKLLTYYGSPKERAAKRQGWSKPNSFHVCITSYTLVLQDSRMFKRKKWKYLILDEAHMIKNWKSQRWQNLLNFNSKRRLLLTGTPLQNDLMELWSLMHFLMPAVFGSHAQFKDWFSNPLNGMVEGSAEYNRAIVDRLHAVLRPFLLRRLKRDVEKQLPGKHEHVIYCRLSKRQRLLYEEYMASGDTRSTLASGNFLGIMNCLMQLRKVCNHPDLFEGRPIVSAFDMEPLQITVPSPVVTATAFDVSHMEDSKPNLANLGLLVLDNLGRQGQYDAEEIGRLAEPDSVFEQAATTPQEDLALLLAPKRGQRPHGTLLESLKFRPRQEALAALSASAQNIAQKRRAWRIDRTSALGKLSRGRIETATALPLGVEIEELVQVRQPVRDVHVEKNQNYLEVSDTISDIVKLPERRADEMVDILQAFTFAIPKARAAPPSLVCNRPDMSTQNEIVRSSQVLEQVYNEKSALLHVPRIRTQLFFPDRRLVQYDCGKLQELALLLTKLKAGGHRALIFTQMSKMLDVLEVFLNLHGYTYVRLDGATKPEMRQILMQRFNADDRIFCFILSTRSGGVGMNLIGADTVIFYDSDWNPAMDAQAQDRCHRIGQTREVHIYRLVSEHTVEENILKKSDQKRQLDWLAIQSGGFTTEFFSKFDPGALLEGGGTGSGIPGGIAGALDAGPSTTQRPSADAIMAAMRAAEDEGDAAAAAAVARETAAEMEEFIKDPPPQSAADLEGAGADDNNANNNGEGTLADEDNGGAADKEDEQQQQQDEAAAKEDDDVARLAGGQIGDAAVAQLEGALSAVERYAVRYLEDTIGMAAEAEIPVPGAEDVQMQEIDVNAIDAQEEEREADIDEDEEANIAADWDTAAANVAFEAEREAAEAAEKEREAAEAAWLAQYTAQFPAIAPSGIIEPSSLYGSWGAALGTTKAAKGNKRGSGRSSQPPADTLDTAVSPRAGKRARIGEERVEPVAIVFPWEQAEDLVLCCSVALLLEGSETVGPQLWTTAADILAAGAASTTMTGIESAAQQGATRTPNACAQRYSMLEAARCAAHHGRGGTAGEPFNTRLANLKRKLAAALSASNKQKEVKSEEDEDIKTEDVEAGNEPVYSQPVLSAVYKVLQNDVSTNAKIVAKSSEMVELLHTLRRRDTTSALGAAVLELPAEPSLQHARDLADAIRSKVRSSVVRVITGRLSAVVEAAKVGGTWAAREALEGAANQRGGGGYGASPQGGYGERRGSGGFALNDGGPAAAAPVDDKLLENDDWLLKGI